MDREYKSDPSSEDEEITCPDKNYFEILLSKYHKETVKASQFEITTKLNGTMFDTIVTVTIKYTLTRTKEERTVFLVVKQLQMHPLSRLLGTFTQYDLREIKFYKVVMPDFKEFQARQLALQDNPVEKIELSVPICYHTYCDSVSETPGVMILRETVLVLEDPRGSGFAEPKFPVGLTLEQTKVAMETIARIHAHSLSMKVIDGQPLPERYPFLFQTAQAAESYENLFERNLPRLADFLQKTEGLGDILEAVVFLRKKTKQIISTLLAPEGPLALITHTNFWCCNMLFRETSTSLECCILDWQMITYSRATNDIALLLVSSIPTELRRTHCDTFLDTYWDTLVSTCRLLGVDIPKDLGYTREDLSKDYRRSQLLALLLCLGSVEVALGDPVSEQRLIDVLKDLYEDGLLTEEVALVFVESEA